MKKNEIRKKFYIGICNDIANDIDYVVALLKRVLYSIDFLDTVIIEEIEGENDELSS